jgi:hypothetical protein
VTAFCDRSGEQRECTVCGGGLVFWPDEEQPSKPLSWCIGCDTNAGASRHPAWPTSADVLP